MTSADDFQRYAECARFAEDFAAGRIELVFDPDGEIPELPQPGAPHHVIRVLKVPLDVDQRARTEAAHRGVEAETVLLEWVTARS